MGDGGQTLEFSEGFLAEDFLPAPETVSAPAVARLVEVVRMAGEAGLRVKPHAYLDLFDGADSNAATAVRASNNTATQALYLMNNEFVQKQADALAVRVGMAEPTVAGRVRLAHRLLFARVPTPAEQQLATTFIAQTTTQTEARAAWTSYMRVLFSSNEFFFID